MSLIDARGEIPLILQSAKAGQNTSLQRNLFGQTKRNEGLELLEQAGGAHFNEFALSILESTVMGIRLTHRTPTYCVRHLLGCCIYRYLLGLGE